ncbi:MAG: DUF1501 domain-containing protein [Phycisphaeraceae bacterium]
MTITRNNLCTPQDHAISRRALLGGAAGVGAGLALGGLTHPAIADALSKKDKQILFVWLDGGISQLESWDPKPNTRFGGPFRAIPTSVKGTHVCELLSQTAKQMHRVCVVRSLCTQDNSHSAGVPRILRGDPKNRGVTYPYFGSAIAKLLGPGASKLPPYVWVKPGSGGFKTEHAGFLGAQYGALAFGDGKAPENLLRPESINAERDAARNELRESLNKRYAAQRRKANTEASMAVFDMAEVLMKRQDLFDATRFSPEDVARYGTHDLGRHMLIARNMLEAGVRFVNVTSYGWDTHGDNFNGQSSLVSKFDQAFSAMLDDLHQRSMLDNVLVIAMSEFGRTPRINGHIGRDHWPEAWSAAMAGCGIQAGSVVGKTNDEGTWVSSQPYDIGSMFHTWFTALGIDTIDTEYDNGGQPLPIAHDDMDPIKEALT